MAEPFSFIPIPEPTQDATGEIAELFTQKEEVSLVRDILPVIFKHHAYQELDQRACLIASSEVAQALIMARHDGISFDCIPQFVPQLSGDMQLSDMTYKRAWCW